MCRNLCVINCFHIERDHFHRVNTALITYMYPFLRRNQSEKNLSFVGHSLSTKNVFTAWNSKCECASFYSRPVFCAALLFFHQISLWVGVLLQQEMETVPIKAARDSVFVHSFFFFFLVRRKGRRNTKQSR